MKICLFAHKRIWKYLNCLNSYGENLLGLECYIDTNSKFFVNRSSYRLHKLESGVGIALVFL